MDGSRLLCIRSLVPFQSLNIGWVLDGSSLPGIRPLGPFQSLNINKWRFQKEYLLVWYMCVSTAFRYFNIS